MAVPSDFGPLRWEKMGKVAKSAKLAIPSDFGPLQWEKIGKGAEQPKLGVLNDFLPLVRTDWKKCQMTKIRHSKSFWTILVRKDWEK